MEIAWRYLIVERWDRQRDEAGKLESNLWFSRFMRYKLQGPDRSLLKLYHEWQDAKGRKRTNNVPGAWRKAAEQWNWRKRAEAWDESERQKLQEEWADRRKEIRTKEWDKAQELIARAELMLKHPLVERVTDHEGQTVILKPANWRVADIPRFLETASKLARLAAQMETERARQEITIGPTIDKLAKHFEELPDAELVKFIRAISNSGESSDT